MTRAELSLLSQAHAVAYAAIGAPETRGPAPMAAAFALREAAGSDMPDFVPACTRFVEDLRLSHGRHADVRKAGQRLRDAVALAMAFVPRDAHRVDIHGPN